jgi:RNA recognition motif-containing protein
MKLYVGNLPFSVDDDKLKELFSAYDVEEATLIKDKFNGRSKGFGFVVIADDEAAKKAIEETNDKEVEGRKLKVSEAKPFDPDAPRPPRRNFNRPRSGGFGGGQRRSFGGDRNGGDRDRAHRDNRNRY